MWTTQIQEEINKLEGTAGVIIKNLRTNETFSHNPELVFPSASIIKVPILLTLLEEHKKGNIDMYAKAPLAKEEVVQGYGIIKELSEGINFSYLDYAVLMITLSDNAATNKLISALTMPVINAKIKALGMNNTGLQRKMMDFEAAKRGLDNYTTPKDMELIFEYIYHNEAECAPAMDILKAQLCNDLLPVWTNHDFLFAHKTGDLTGSKHDTGIMFLSDPIFAAVLTRDMKDNNNGVKLSNEIGRLIYEHYKPQVGLKAAF